MNPSRGFAKTSNLPRRANRRRAKTASLTAITPKPGGPRSATLLMHLASTPQ
jgi:hypothetical protein